MKVCGCSGVTVVTTCDGRRRSQIITFFFGALGSTNKIPSVFSAQDREREPLLCLYPFVSRRYTDVNVPVSVVHFNVGATET